MDIFKLLSRSTNLKTKATAQKSLPSSGQHANPQLFGRDASEENRAQDHEGSNGFAVLGKRKRGSKAKDSVPQGLDFFGAGDTSSKTADVNPGQEANDSQQNIKSKADPLEHQAETMSEEQRRASLKEHKIKVTVLEEIDTAKDVTPKKSKKKRSKDKAHDRDQKKTKRKIYPEPLASFSQLRSRYSISRRLAENLESQGYKVPTEVQLAALPLLMDDQYVTTEESRDVASGCHLLSIAPTGSGKTLAFLIPTINSILRDKRDIRDEHTQAIVLAPTRELAHQIVDEGKKLLQNTGIRITLMRKGMRLAGSEAAEQASEETNSDEGSDEEPNRGIVKAHIVVSTPMVLANSLSAKSAFTLATLRHLILDEADVLLDPLFREQFEKIWNSCTNQDLRITLWSATMGSSIEDFALEQFSKLGHKGRVPIVRLVVGLKDTALPTLTHTMTYTGTEAGKLLALRQLLHPTAPDTDSEGRKSLRPPFLVFTQTIERAKALQAELRYDIPPEAGGSARMAALHSEMSEKAREKVMADFRKGEIWVIITTDLLARGVDFRGLNGVVNYDVPTSAAAYVHRVGRTGRAGREGGVAVTFYTKDDIPYVKPIANVIAASEKLRGKESQTVDGHKDLQQWMLNALPTPTKREKNELKKKGVEARRKGAKSAMITTKSGYERKQNSRARDMKGGGKNFGKGANAQQLGVRAPKTKADDDFAGFSD